MLFKFFPPIISQKKNSKHAVLGIMSLCPSIQDSQMDPFFRNAVVINRIPGRLRFSRDYAYIYLGNKSIVIFCTIL